MARYRIINAISQSFIDVFAPDITGLPAPTLTDVYVRNVDNTITHVVGINLAISGGVATGGTVTSVTRTSDVAGTVTYEIADQLTSANNSFASFWNAPNATARQTYATSQGDDGFGSAGVDVINLGIGDNNFTGYQGNDTFIGNSGFDFINYAAEQSNGGTFGIILNLSSNSVTASVTGGTFTVASNNGHDAFGFTDTMINIDGGNGTNFADALYGNSGNNSLRPYGGNDFVDGGGGFDEWQAAGTGTTGSFVPTQGVIVTYTAGTSFDGIVNNDGFGTSDTFLSIERIRGTPFADTFNGNAANNSFRGLNGNDTLNGGGGFDEANYTQDSNYGGTAGVIVNLTGASITATIGAGTFALAGGTARDGFGATDTLNGIEYVQGTSSGDYLVGSAWDNDLLGGGGNDTLLGGDGFDFFTPGAGTDVVDGSPGTHPDQSYDDRDYVSYNDGANGVGVIVNLSNAAITQTIGAGTFSVAATSARDWSGSTDTLIDIERVRGTNQADYFRGSDTNNLRSEQFDGLAGNDTINGGAGTDTARYDVDDNNGGLSGIIANLSTSSTTSTIASGTFTVASNNVRDGFGDTDTLIGIENIRGTAFNDVFVGSAGNNLFRIVGGSDTIDGGAGFDTIDLFVDDSFPAVGATVNLANHTATAVGGGGSSVLTSIEDVDGSTGADNITGDGNGNLLDGYYGNDTIDGAGGIDLINGGAGNNSLTGGSEFDYLSYLYDPALAQSYNLQYPAQQSVVNQGVTVNLLNHTATNWAGGTDSVNGFEAVVGTFFADTITGDAGDNTFYGLSGNDIIDGGAGKDTVAYGVWDNLGRVSVPLVGINFSNPNGVIVNLGTTAVTATIGSGTFTVQGGHANDGEGGTDTLTSIENVNGSRGADFIVGSSAANTITGDLGNDSILGGLGRDTAAFSSTNSGSTLARANAVWTVTGSDGTDTLTSVEVARFSDRTVDLVQAVRRDLDGNRTSDVLLHSASNGIVGDFRTDSAGQGTWNYINYASPGFAVAGRGDINGDGFSDIVIENATSGIIGAFTMNGAGQGTWNYIGFESSGFAVKGVADLNGDGIADVLIHNASNGIVGDFQMNSAGQGSFNYIGYASPGFAVVGTGDINGDGITDVVIENSSSGIIGAFAMNSAGQGTWNYIGFESPGFAVKGVADLNGDGIADVLIHNASNGIVGDFQMNSAGVGSFNYIGFASPGFAVVGTGDFNGNGVTDVVIENSSNGIIGGFSMNSAGQGTWNYIGFESAGFGVKSVSDYNGDGIADILIHNTSNGIVGDFLMNNAGVGTFNYVGFASSGLNVIDK